jgi:hypothetical protein
MHPQAGGVSAQEGLHHTPYDPYDIRHTIISSMTNGATLAQGGWCARHQSRGRAVHVRWAMHRTSHGTARAHDALYLPGRPLVPPRQLPARGRPRAAGKGRVTRAIALVCCRGVPGVMQLIGFPEEGLPDSSAFPCEGVSSKKCENRISIFHTFLRENRLRSSAFPIPPPKGFRGQGVRV